MARYLVDSAEHLSSLQPPYSAGGVDATGTYKVGVHFVPVKRCERGTEIWVLIVVQHAFEESVRFPSTPDAKVITWKKGWLAVSGN